MSLLEQFLSEKHLEAIAAMLFHSLWQGALLACAAGGVLLLTKRSSSALRYRLLVFLLCIFAAGVAYTYLGHLSANTPGDGISAGAAIDQAQPADQQVISGNFLSEAARSFHTNAPIIVSCWLLLIFCAWAFL